MPGLKKDEYVGYEVRQLLGTNEWRMRTYDFPIAHDGVADIVLLEQAAQQIVSLFLARPTFVDHLVHVFLRRHQLIAQCSRRDARTSSSLNAARMRRKFFVMLGNQSGYIKRTAMFVLTMTMHSLNEIWWPAGTVSSSPQDMARPKPRRGMSI